jgi:hypothetical protein
VACVDRNSDKAGHCQWGTVRGQSTITLPIACLNPTLNYLTRKQAEESAEATTDLGLKFIATLKSAKDKHGRLITNEFLVLPHKVTIIPASLIEHF